VIRPRLLLGLACVATLAIWFAPSSKEVVEATSDPLVTRVSPPLEKTPPLAAIPDLSLRPLSFEKAAGRLLASESPKKIATKVEAVNPTLPDDFKLLGKAEIDGKWKAIVAFAGKTELAGGGDRVQDRFLVEAVDPPRLVIIDLKQNSHRFILSVGEIR
jgi:hypothetical protein